MPHIVLNKLHVTYKGGHTGLADISVSIPDGQITAVIGPSGCGKSTLLKSINRLLDLTDGVSVRGTVMIDDQDVYAPDANLILLRKKVGFLSQRPYPLPMSIYDNVAFGPRIHGFSHDEMKSLAAQLAVASHVPLNPLPGETPCDILVRHCLSAAGLWNEVRERLHQPASRLSLGQQQRLALARALAVGPEAILADEPTSALDPISTQLIEQQLRALRGTYTIVIVTHILRQARRLADYLLFMYMGTLVEHGPATQLFASPTHPETRRYISGEIS
ncbi:MAG: phosphate ABC transporter ATP-binding protein [bacterium]|nr:phosphate ABC transporter ATP-binding protein [bacterium]